MAGNIGFGRIGTAGKICDTREKGLSAYVTDQGIITFFLRKRINGKDQRIHLGHFPDLSVDDARKKALAVKGDIAQGIDPNQDKSISRQQVMTFGQMFQEYMERYSKPSKKTWRADEQEVTRFLSHLFSRPASEITRKELLELHERIGREHGFYQANSVLKRVRAIYNKTIEFGWEGTNPTHGIKKFQEKSRDRFLRKDEMLRFFKALAEETNGAVRDCLLICLLTGARKSNVLAMRWDQVNFALREWHIPETKNGEPHVIPLTDPAIEILQERRQHFQSPYVFPGKGSKGHLSNLKWGWNRVLKRAGLSNLRIHDLRRTLGSWMAAMGATTAIIGKTLAHKSAEATKIYERLDIEPVREFIMRTNDAFLQAAYSERSVFDKETREPGQKVRSRTPANVVKKLGVLLGQDSNAHNRSGERK